MTLYIKCPCCKKAFYVNDDIEKATDSPDSKYFVPEPERKTGSQDDN